MSSIKNYIIKISITVCLFIGLGYWSLISNNALGAMVNIISILIPGEIIYDKIHGNILHGFEIFDIHYVNKYIDISATKLTANLRNRYIRLNKVKNLNILHKFINDQNCLIDEFTLQQDHTNKYYTIHTTGVWNNKPLHIDAKFQFKPLLSQDWSQSYFKIRIGLEQIYSANNINLQIKANIKDLHVLHSQFKGDLNLSLKFNHSFDNSLHLQSEITSNKFTFKDYFIQKIAIKSEVPLRMQTKDHLYIHIASGPITIGNTILRNFDLLFQGSYDRHDIHINSNILNNPISFHGYGVYKNYLYKIYSDSDENNIQMIFNLSNSILLNNTLNIKLDLRDIKDIALFIPDISRLRGRLHGEINLYTDNETPAFNGTVYIKDISAKIPKLGIKIKPFNATLNFKQDTINIEGHGLNRNAKGAFTITGFIKPFSENISNRFNLKTQEFEIIKTIDKQAIIDSDIHITMDWEQDALYASGKIQVLSGNINFKNSNTVIKSQDIVFIDNLPNTHLSSFAIIPDIFIRINENVHFSAFNLKGNITGKLQITSKNNILHGEGRISIKEGEYTLTREKLYIKKGRLIYPEGALLKNPWLDIKMLKYKSLGSGEIEKGIFLQGTANDPIISEIGITGEEHQALSQAIMTGTNIIPNEIYDMLLDELTIEDSTEVSSDFFDELQQGDPQNNKTIVAGRRFGKNIYVKCKMNVSDDEKFLFIKYAINQFLFFGVEASGKGQGADLSFAVQKK